MPDKHYQLQYGYMHCVGRTTYAAGTVRTQTEALEWVTAQSVSKPGVRVPDKDPVRWCPVKHCHMKRQKPWFAFREVVNAEPGSQTDTCEKAKAI